VGGLALLAGCSPDAAGPARASAPEVAATPSSSSIEEELRDLVVAVTPSDPSAPPVERSDWFGRRKKLLERLRQEGPELGRAALERYRKGEDEVVEVREGLLDVAAHTAADDARPTLVELVTTYGADLGLRARACELLAETSPETALQLLEPILTSTGRSETYPPEDRMLQAWLDAAHALGRDPAEVLARIVIEPRTAAESRHLAARALGDAPSSVGRQALESVLTESSGDNYLRRLATQSLQRTLPAGDFCPLVRGVLEHEADVNFQIFLASVLEKTCP